jgi:Flp pilus assembly pilin Flp
MASVPAGRSVTGTPRSIKEGARVPGFSCIVTRLGCDCRGVAALEYAVISAVGLGVTLTLVDRFSAWLLDIVGILITRMA